MSNNEIIENEEQNEIIEQEENSGPSRSSLMADKLKNWINGQNKAAVYTIGALIIAGAGIAAYLFLYKYPKEEEGLNAIYKTQNLFMSDSFAMVLKDAPKLAEKYSGTKAGNIAAYMSGVSYLRTGDYKNAIKFLEETSFNDAELKSGSVGLLGDAYIESKQLEKGLELYLKAAKSSTLGADGVRWYRKAARVCEKKEDWKQALVIYETIKKDFREEESASDIDKYIARAKSKLDIY